MIPKKLFFTKGVGKHKDYLQSFELALRDAGIEKCNLVNVSSILPPKCKIIYREQGLQEIKPGEITFCVMARNATNEPNRLVAASIGCAVPAEENQYGYLSEHHSFGETEKIAGKYAEEMAATMLATTLGLEVDSNLEYDAMMEQYKMSGKIVKTRSITQSALGDKNGLWTSVIAVVVFVGEEEKSEVTELPLSQTHLAVNNNSNNNHKTKTNNNHKSSQNDQKN